MAKKGREGLMKPAFALKRAVRDRYPELILEFPLTSIRDDRHLEEAQRVLDALSANVPLSEGEEVYLDALSDLVGAYEDEHYPIAPPSDADMLRHLIDARGITQAQLSRDTSIPKSTISEVLAGKRPFSRQLIRRLASYFKVDVSVLAANI